ncbi:MAG: hypothetical protein F6K47_34700 [Symploca sp. SIO2E6]|nr:hypothetical protein [Symploca sp. SIO2E6]
MVIIGELGIGNWELVIGNWELRIRELLPKHHSCTIRIAGQKWVIY